MPHRLYRVIDFEIVGKYTLWLKFNDSAERIINFEPVLHGEVFGPLRDPLYFNQVKLDMDARTIVWPTGADFDPETLHNWNDEAMARLGRQWSQVVVHA